MSNELKIYTFTYFYIWEDVGKLTMIVETKPLLSGHL